MQFLSSVNGWDEPATRVPLSYCARICVMRVQAYQFCLWGFKPNLSPRGILFSVAAISHFASSCRPDLTNSWTGFGAHSWATLNEGRGALGALSFFDVCFQGFYCLCWPIPSLCLKCRHPNLVRSVKKEAVLKFEWRQEAWEGSL